jgi:hypothetical protein
VTGANSEASTLSPAPPLSPAEQLGCNLHANPTQQPEPAPHAHSWATTQPSLFHPGNPMPSADLLPRAEPLAADEALTTDLVAATAHGAHSFSPEEGTSSGNGAQPFTPTTTTTASSSSSTGFSWPPHSTAGYQLTQPPYLQAPHYHHQQEDQETHSERPLLQRQLLQQSKLMQELCSRLADLQSLVAHHSSSSSQGLDGSHSPTLAPSLRSQDLASFQQQQQANPQQSSSQLNHADATASEGEGAGATSSSSSTGPAGASLTHVDGSGAASMVDVSSKHHSKRVATASCRVLLGPCAFSLVEVGH